MAALYFDSPHKQITEDFECIVTKVTDGDTIKVKWADRDFEFPIRLSNIAAAELNEEGGAKSKSWLESQIDKSRVLITIDPRNRVGKWGRIIGEVIHGGININEESMRQFQSTEFSQREKSSFEDFDKMMEEFSI